MVEQDKKQFSEIFFAVAQLYEKEMNKMKLSVYFSALQNYSISQVQEGVNKHVKNTETGSFMPKPSDIIKQLEGTQKDAQRQLEGMAEIQWMNVMTAIGRYGSYQTPKLDDPYTRACITALGGWTPLCAKTTEQLTWVGKEFVKLYQNMNTKPLHQLPDNVKGLEDIQKLKGESIGIMQNLEDRFVKEFGGAK
jgi:hypothetical protein